MIFGALSLPFCALVCGCNSKKEPLFAMGAILFVAQVLHWAAQEEAFEGLTETINGLTQYPPKFDQPENL